MNALRRQENPESRDWLAWLFAFVVFLCTYDAVSGTDKPLLLFSVALLCAAAWKRDTRLLPCAFLLFYMYALARYYPPWVWLVPTAGFFAPLVLTFLSCMPFRALRSGFAWFRRGRLDRITWFLLILTSLLSALALILWALWTNYLGVATQMIAPLKAAPRWFSLLVLVPGFALANAAAEEAVYRGVIQYALEKVFAQRAWLALALQASAFAAAHFIAGFPNGKIGYLMTFVYALLLGWLRRRTNGMLAPYIAHVVADTVIGVTLVLLAG
ncbi:MAG: CPBP family glutamic-type intramembrane protease [Bdellovibrionota bacterium]